jgi:hypothetical protein
MRATLDNFCSVVKARLILSALNPIIDYITAVRMTNAIYRAFLRPEPNVFPRFRDQLFEVNDVKIIFVLFSVQWIVSVVRLIDRL